MLRTIEKIDSKVITTEFRLISRPTVDALSLLLVQTDDGLEVLAYDDRHEGAAIEEARDYFRGRVKQVTTFRQTGGRRYRAWN
jgi:hypothetical protein